MTENESEDLADILDQHHPHPVHGCECQISLADDDGVCPFLTEPWSIHVVNIVVSGDALMLARDILFAEHKDNPDAPLPMVRAGCAEPLAEALFLMGWRRLLLKAISISERPDGTLYPTSTSKCDSTLRSSPCLIPPVPPKGCQHCDLPVPDEDIILLGTLAQCRGCGNWFRHVDTFSGEGSALSSWKPVRWFNFLSRRRIKEERNV